MATKTFKTIRIVDAYRKITPAKLTKMESAERSAILLAIRQLKKVATEYDDFLKDAQEKLKPDGFDAIVGKIQKNEGLTVEEASAFNKYSKELDECMKPVADKEVELDFEPLSDAAMAHFIESNDFSVNDIFAIEDVIGV